MRKILYIIASLTLIFSACRKDFEVEYTTAYLLAGTWYVVAYDASLTALTGHDKIQTYNTSDDNTDIWVDDIQHFLDIKVKCQGDIENLTFQGENLISEYDEDFTLSIADGQIFEGEGRSRTGVVTDSIYFKVIDLSDGTEYIMAGHRVTGFLEDDY